MGSRSKWLLVEKIVGNGFEFYYSLKKVMSHALRSIIHFRNWKKFTIFSYKFLQPRTALLCADEALYNIDTR